MKNLYNDLVNLVKNSHEYGFTYTDLSYEDRVYRIFDYGITSWSSFLMENAVNCRGTMFDITEPDSPLLVSLPPPKFFNYHEGTIDHTNNKHLGSIMVKRDGSLISTYLHNGQLKLKSKGHLFSDQARWAESLLDKNYPQLKEELKQIAEQNFTINMEYTAPNNVIVVFYPQEELSILSIRDHKTGKLYHSEALKRKFRDYPEVLKNLVSSRLAQGIAGKDIENYINGVLEETEGEGYVIEIVNSNSVSEESYLVKIKNKKYVLIHSTKAAIESPKKVIECILNGQTDDLRALFAQDNDVLKYLNNLETIAVKRYNEFKHKIETFAQNNKDLPIKEFAMKSEKELGPVKSLAINLYKGQPNDYIYYIIKNKESFFPEIKFSGEKNYRKVIKND